MKKPVITELLSDNLQLTFIYPKNSDTGIKSVFLYEYTFTLKSPILSALICIGISSAGGLDLLYKLSFCALTPQKFLSCNGLSFKCPFISCGVS